MKTRWSTAALLGAVAASLLLTPTLASAQVFLYRPGGFGGYGGYGGYSPFGYGGYSPYGYGGYSMPYYSSSWMSQQRSFYTVPAYSGMMYQPRQVSPGYLPETGGSLGYSGYNSNQVVLPGWAARASQPLPRMRQSLEPAIAVASFTQPGVNQSAAHIQVQVCAADAEVLFDGSATTQTGMLREFSTPPLEAGTYTYTVVARWRSQGQLQSAKRTVSVGPGSRVVVDLTTP